MLEELYNFLGTLLGALFGIPAGFALNHLWGKWVGRNRRAQLKSAFKESLKNNASLVARIEECLDQGSSVPLYNIDLVLLESTASLKYEVLNDIELCKEIDYLRHELALLARKLDLLSDLEFNPSSRLAIDDPNGSFYNILRPKLIATIKSQVDPINERLREVASRLS